ncbi:hypothetical protein TEA_003658 [Camellia sinensis var. sinensis]|uniref:Phytochelatin synthase C-terminal domain-containing protein n=1 Tax=Camellia sinensis var. sinensis TaxID=542762 RepID=A0A4S4E4Q6_CAMSN|nr:hypothetical protein TEA_003658 [Camellia sinensis var. sinensis]
MSHFGDNAHRLCISIMCTSVMSIIANVASYGGKHSTLNPGSSGRLYSTDSAGSSKGNYESVSVEMSEPVTCSREQGPGKIIQTIDPSMSGCSVNNGHLIVNDALTMLLLALPSHMWSGIKESNLSAEFNSLVSIESVPHILKKELMNQRVFHSPRAANHYDMLSDTSRNQQDESFDIVHGNNSEGGIQEDDCDWQLL